MMEKLYDVLIAGGGPAGYTAALYCARAGLSAVVVEETAPGGQMGTTDVIDNYPGFPEGVNGFDLAMKMQEGAVRFGVETRMEKITEMHLTDDVKEIVTEGGSYSASAVILAMGAAPRELGLPNERALRGKGVSYCATCDGMFYRGETVVIVGGGDTAAADAVFLSKLCKKVYLVHRRDTLRASKAYSKPLEVCENVEFIWDTAIEQILEENGVKGVLLKNKKTEETRELLCQGVFVAVGNIPNTTLLRDQIDLDEHGYVKSSETTETNLPGVFAAGDLRRKPLRQVVTAVADGAVSARFAEEYLATGVPSQG